MKIDAQPKWLSNLDPKAINSLTLNNKRLVEGSSQVLVSPSYDEIDDAEISKKLEEILDKHHLTSKLREIEDSNRSKLGPRSIAKPWLDRKESLHAYFDKEDLDPGGFGSPGDGRGRPATVDSAVKGLVKRSNSGLPYMQRKGKILRQIEDGNVNDRGLYPCALFTRTQEQKKTRNVWGYPVSDTVWEQTYFSPWLHYEKSLAYRAALNGPEAVDGAVTLLLSRWRPNQVIMSVDFEQFDASIQTEHTYNAFAQIASWFQSQYSDDIYRLFRRFITIPVYTPEGEWSGPHGVPSGSTWTNTVDSLVQFMISQHEQRDCQVQGDDGLYLTDQSMRDVLFDRFKESGLNVNESKSDVFEGPEAIFLQRYYHSDYVSRTGPGLGGVYSGYRAFHRLKYLERWTDFEEEEIDASDYFSLRAVMILENCKHHPAFEDIVRLAHAYDKRGLKFTQAGLTAFSRAIEPRARAGVLHTESLSKGINRFETMKVLRTL